MYRSRTLVSLFSVSLILGSWALAGDPLGCVAKSSFEFPAGLEKVGVDSETKQKMEEIVADAEPRIRELNSRIVKLQSAVDDQFTADVLDEEAIVDRMATLLDAKKELALHRVRVRVGMLSQLTSQQRQTVFEPKKQKCGSGCNKKQDVESDQGTEPNSQQVTLRKQKEV